MHAPRFLTALVLSLGLAIAGCGGDGETVYNSTVVPQAVQIETTVLPDAVEGDAYAVTLLASGGSGTLSWSLETGGTNDAWLTLDAGTGDLSGTPGSAQFGTVILVLRAEDASDPANFDIAVVGFEVTADPDEVAVTTQSLPDAFSNILYTQYLQASGGSGSYSWGKLPGGTNDAWISVSSTGLINVMPNINHLGPVTLKVGVMDTNQPSLYATAEFALTVYNGTLTIDNDAALLNAAASQPYSVALRTTGGSGSLHWAKESGGSNDAWITVDPDTGALSGTAPAQTGGVSLVVSAVDTTNAAVNAQKTFTFEIRDLALTVESLPDAFVGQSYSQALGAVGGAGSPTYTIEPGGSNYGWLSINGTALECTAGPSAAEKGSVTVLVRVTDGSDTDTRAYTFEVYDTVAIQPSLPDAQVGVGYSALPSVSGGTGDFTWSLGSGGTNDAWLSIDPATGRLSGVPTEAELGPVTVVLTVTENDHPSLSDQENVSFTVQGIAIETETLPDATVSTAYSAQMSVSGGSGYYGWSITAGPSWLSIDPDTGALSGTPASSAAESVTVQVDDSLYPSLTDSRTFTFWTVATYLQEDFETSPTGWQIPYPWQRGIRDHSNNSSRVYVGPRNAHRGTYCLGTNLSGHYPNGNGWVTLTSPAFDLTSATAPVLVYYQWMQAAPGDGGNLKVSTNGQAGPFALETSITPAYNATANAEAAYSGYHVSRSDGGWRQVVVDLSGYAGQASVSVQWAFYDDSDATVHPGWYVDDVHVFEMPGSPAPDQVQGHLPAGGCTFAPPCSSDFTAGVILRWERARGAATYDLHLGTDSTAVAQSTTPTQSGLASPQATVTTLSAGNTYYWRVDAVGASTTTGSVQSFTTSDPVPVFVNEIQTCPGLGPYVEIYNPDPSVWQDLSGYELHTTSGGANHQTHALPAGYFLAPGEARVLGDRALAYHGYAPYRIWDMLSLPFSIGWNYGNTEGEAWLLDPSGTGVDYVGWNVSTSHLPADLAFAGTLTQTNMYFAILRRSSNTDNDAASDFSWSYYYYYSAAYGYFGLKDPGQ